MTDQRHPSSECPSCGRFVGPYGRCPYCGADIGQRVSVRALKYGSVLLAILGLAILLVAAARTQVPKVEVGKLGGTMNWAYIQVEGVVTRQPTYDAEEGTLKFWVWDGTGEILVSAYRAEAETLLAQERVPMMGDSVTVEGTLRIKDEFQYLVLNVPQQLEILSTEPVEHPIADVTHELLYQKVRVRGQVRHVRAPYEGLQILTLRDASGEIDIVLQSGPPSAGSVDLSNLTVGQGLQAVGAVDLYMGSPQISVGWADELQLLREATSIAPRRRISELSTGALEAMVEIEGTINDVNPFSAGVKLQVDDGTGILTILLWQDIIDQLGEHDTLLVEGSIIQAQGEIAEYQGELELVPELPCDLKGLAVGKRSVRERQLAELSTDDVGQLVRVEGVLRSMRSFSAGIKGALDDGTATVTILLWKEVYDALAEPGLLVPGAILRLEGEVSEYKGELEIVPQVPADLTVTGQIDLPLHDTAIGQITVDDVGQTLRVAGQVVEATPFSKGLRCTLDDTTGTITLLLWQNVWKELVDGSLVEGTRVAVRGIVAEYRDQIEIIPQIPADVTVLSPPGEAVLAPSVTAEVATAEPTTKPEETQEPTPRSIAPTLGPEPQPETREIGQITHGDIGRAYTVEQATITEVWWTTGGANHRISDGRDSLILFIFQDDYEQMSPDFRYDLMPGSVLQVTGQISEWQGELEILPRVEANIKVISVAERHPLESRQLANIGPADEGRWFAIEGTVEAVQPFSQGTKLLVSDGTADMVVLLWQNIYERVQSRDQLGVGGNIRAIGQFLIWAEGGNEFQIVPRAGRDVEVSE